MADDDMPFMAERDDPLTTKVELLPPTSASEVLVNGLLVPHLTVQEGTSTVTLIVDRRMAWDLPIELFENVAGLVANVIAVERGYGCWPSVPEDHDKPKAPAFGPIHHEVGSVTTGEGDDA